MASSEKPKDKRSIAETIQWLIHFLVHDLFRITDREFGKTTGFFLRLLKKIVLSVKGFFDDNIMIQASALTYYTLLSVVPILALFLAIGRGFGIQESILQWIEKMLGDNSDITPFIMGFVENYLGQVNGGIFLGVGIGVLLWAVVSMFRQIENSFNIIWNVKKNRSIVRQFTTYLTIMVVVPLLVVLSTSISAKVDEYVLMIANSSVGSFLIPIYQFFVKLLPYVIYWMLFAILFLVVPNTKVRFLDALTSGIVVGTAFLLLQYLYVNGIISLSKYNAVYGSFAAIPLFLFWMQLSWLVVLYGAELCYVSQNLMNFDFEHDAKNISRRYSEYLEIVILKIIINRFVKNEPPITANEIATTYNIPIRLVLDDLRLLNDTNLISEIYVDHMTERSYQPAMDVNLMTLALVEERLNCHGSESFKLIGVEEYATVWSNIEALKAIAKEKAGEILIKDL